MPALLRSLGIVGWDALEPAILAALATESPLLLIGPHGSAKTLLLTRLAEALSLVHRHYNASILNFDDLLGYPVPQDGRLVYLQTPATIWEAEAVLFDEVSRCRPELQNKLFPLVHERVVQGIPLTKLRHRWAAMNPPPGEGENAGPTYDGALPLDLALADRFPFVLVVPSFAELSESDQTALLRAKPGAAAAPAGELQAAIATTREQIESGPKLLEYEAAEYARALALKLGAAGHPLSTRRVVALVRNVVALRAAHLALGHEAGAVEDAFFDAARFSIPDAAWGKPVDGQKLLTAHRAAWAVAHLAEGSPLRALLTETDPLRLIALSLQRGIEPAEAGSVLTDAFASLPKPARLATAAVLFPRLGARCDLPAVALEVVAAECARVAKAGSERIRVKTGLDWKRDFLSTHLAGINTRTQRGRVLQNAALALLAEDERFEFGDLVRALDRALAVLGPPGRRGDAAAAEKAA